MAALQEATAVTNGLVNVGPGPDLELAPELRSDNNRRRAVTDAVVTRHKRYTSGYPSDDLTIDVDAEIKRLQLETAKTKQRLAGCLLYTSPSPRDRTRSRMPSSA